MRNKIKFENLFSIEEIQKLQSAIKLAHNLGSVITQPDGTPISEIIDYPELCTKIIRTNPKGLELCTKYASCMSVEGTNDITIAPCLSCGLLNASIPIIVKGEHLANCIIGPVRSKTDNTEDIVRSANAINEEVNRFIIAYNAVPIMPKDGLNSVTQSIHTMVHLAIDKAIVQYEQKETIEMLKHTEMALRESEERFQTLFQQAPLGYQSLDIDGHLIEVNQQWLDTLGYTRNEAIGKWFGDFLAPQYRDGFLKRFPLFKSLGAIHSEFGMVHKDGTIRYIAFDGKIGKTDDGDFKQTHCILQDITETHKAQEALIASEEKFRSLFDQSPIGSAIVDLSMFFVLCNNAFCDFLGYSADELVGKSIADITHPEDLKIGLREITGIAKSQIERASLEKRYIRKNGETVWGEVTICAIRNQDGEPMFFLPIVQDITARKAAEQELNLRIDELVRFQRVTVNRELAMIALKEEINKLLAELGRPTKYKIV